MNRNTSRTSATARTATGNGRKTPSANNGINSANNPATSSGSSESMSKNAYDTPAYSPATTPGSRTSVFPISTNRPPGPSNRNDASMKSPVNEFNTTSTP